MLLDYSVGLIDLLKPLLCIMLDVFTKACCADPVGMVLPCKFPICGPDLLVCGIWGTAENRIIIADVL